MEGDDFIKAKDEQSEKKLKPINEKYLQWGP